MKRIAIFVGLKVLEIGGVVFVPWGVGILGKRLFPEFFRLTPTWLTGLLVLGFMGVLVSVCVGMCCIVKANWLKAGELAGKGEE